jgi:hypothetical protein
VIFSKDFCSEMSNKSYLNKKRCACCTLFLSHLKDNQIQSVSSQPLLEKLNAARSAILEKKKRTIDNNVIESGNLVCKPCINFANRFKPSTSTKRQTTRRLTIHPLFRDQSEASTSRVSSSSDESTYEEEQVIEKISVAIPRTSINNKNCVVCKTSGKLSRVPQQAFLNAFIERNIIIPNGSRCCKKHLNAHDKTFNEASMNNLTVESDTTELTGFEVKMLLDNLRHSARTGILINSQNLTQLQKMNAFAIRELQRSNLLL